MVSGILCLTKHEINICILCCLVDVVLIEGQAPGGSIVGISPGIQIGSNNGSIVGITPGAVLERKSVKDLAAGLSRMGGKRSTILFYLV